MDTNETPFELGCRWPAEWEPHSATWIAWPHNVETWPGQFQSIPMLFAEIIRTLARFEPVHVLAGGEKPYCQAAEMLGELPGVTLFDIPTNDVWVRDYGPTFLHSASGDAVVAVDWQFNSWGGKYPPWDEDNVVSKRILERLAIRRFTSQVVLEGGAIDGNGCGGVLTTRSCLLDPRRNSSMTAARCESLLQRYLGAAQIIWIQGGPMAGDDTDGHVDQLARFVSPRQVVVAVEPNMQDDNHEPLQRNLQMLTDYRDAHGESLEIVPLPMPEAMYVSGQRVPASYCNFYIANRCVLVPVFDDPKDSEALQTLAALLPGREVVPIASRQLIWGLGALHCITQQQPRPMAGPR
jgi:agmatine deiminase